MVDINISLFIQLANFIVLLVALNFILFKPVREIMRERQQGIIGAYTDAKAAQEKVQILQEQYNTSLAESKQKAAASYNTLYQQGLDAQRDMISAERTKASEALDKARAEISQAAQAAKADLRSEADKLAKDIATTLLGRAV
ncbi:MAG: ATP synthase F0 subunit B [Nitrospiraceae bacterium]|nr:ATP synthase F0 subunit B [Nitrospiraceae bacterium]